MGTRFTTWASSNRIDTHDRGRLQKQNADAIGHEAWLLVKSTSSSMKEEDLVTLNERGLAPPVILGGRALNRRYVEVDLAGDLQRASFFYGEDAFEGLRVME